MSGMGHNSNGDYANLTERRRVAAKYASEMAAERNFLEDMRKPTLERIAQKIIDAGEKTYAKAERAARRSDEYVQYLKGLRMAREEAGNAYAEVGYLDMRFKEWQGLNATAREEMRQHGR